MHPKRWQAKVGEALLLFIAVAVVARVASEQLGPLLPAALSGLVIVSVLTLLIRRR